MLKYIRRLAVPAVCAIVLVAGCKGDNANSDSATLKSDSALAADLAMANRDSAAQVQLNDVPVTKTGGTTKTTTRPAPTKTVPRPATPAPTTTASGNTVTKNPGSGSGSGVGTIGAGTTMALTANSKVCTDNAVGDRITASTTETITGSNGVTIPAGSDVTLEVTRLKRSENVNDKIIMEFRVVSVRVASKSYPMTASVTDADIARVRDQPKDKDIQKVVGGAVIGAIAGKVIGGSTKATVGGAAAGAAAGAATAAATANYQGCINAGNRIVVRLDSPLEIVRGN
jgi:hypothetical protein